MSNSSWLQVRIRDDEKAAWKAAADEAGMSLSEWVRSRCNPVVGVVDVPPAEPVSAEPAVPAPKKSGKIGRELRCTLCRKKARLGYQVPDRCEECAKLKGGKE